MTYSEAKEFTIMSHYSNIGENLKKIMHFNELTISQLANKSNISEDTIKSIRSGKTKNPGILIIAAIADAIPCSIDLLLNKDIPDKDNHFDSSINLFNPINILNTMNNQTREFSEAMLNILLSIQEAPSFEDATVITALIPMVGYENGASLTNFTIDTIPLLASNNMPIDFAIKIISDTLEPFFKRGSFVAIKRNIPTNGDIVLCLKNGIVYLRKYEETKDSAYLHHIKHKHIPSFDIKNDKIYYLGIATGVLHQN